MVQEETNLIVADNSGAKKVRCIRILGGHDRRYAGLGDVVVVSVKSAAVAGQKRKAEALKKKAKPAQAPVQASAAPAIDQRTARETAAPVPTPATGKVVISFASPIPEGHVMVSFNDKFIFRKSFAFGKKSGGGQVDGSAEIPSGRGTFKVWVIAPDRSINQYKEFPASVPGGDTKTLRLDLDAGGNLSVSLK